MIEALLSKMIKTGDLTAHLPGGKVIKAGDGTGPPVTIRINSRGLRRLANPSLGLGEGYMEEDIVFEQGTISDLLTIVGESGGRKPKQGSGLTRLRKGLSKAGLGGKVEVRATSARWAWVEYMIAQAESVAGLAIMDAHRAGGSFAAYKKAFAARGVEPTGPRARVPSSLELIALRKKQLAS